MTALRNDGFVMNLDMGIIKGPALIEGTNLSLKEHIC